MALCDGFALVELMARLLRRRSQFGVLDLFGGGISGLDHWRRCKPDPALSLDKSGYGFETDS
jgi:hypothetical protein